ncbi:hypothetical protein AUC61_03340 [Pseudomonas sp. S25]|uniref:Uncharacterized protein n=1 Tax=Pseudomonas maioricensis TaxID=1766623 RepID=A0ABS9ZES7_9PSED|nr:hypothetical protein [Pseudomonas sp. S25]MCI8208561.1 hypothetical protein [Pseudomonas sp. S25]
MKLLGKALTAMILIFFIWYMSVPIATLHYPEDGVDEINYRWNTHHRIYRGGLYPGEKATEPGELFPKDGFFMVVEWWKNRVYWGCAKVSPRWYGTDVHLDKNGDLDIHPEGPTDLERVKLCTDPPAADIACYPC